MSLDYDARRWLRRTGGVVAPLLLLPMAAWLYAATPPSAPADLRPTPSAPPATTPADAGRDDGVVVRVTALPDGSFAIVETVQLGRPSATVRLAPADLERAGVQFAAVTPSVSEVEVLVPGQPPVRVADVRAGTTVELANPTDSLEVRYLLDGTAVRTAPSPPGRALGAVAPLVVTGGFVIFELGGPPVLNVTCPMRPTEQLLCATKGRDMLITWAQPAGEAIVVVQLDLDD